MRHLFHFIRQLPPQERKRLYIRSDEHTLSGPKHEAVRLEGEFIGSTGDPNTIYLGEALTNDEGHLVVLPGYGDSRSYKKDSDPYPLILNDFDSPDWVDDTSDGWIKVTATHSGSTKS